MNIGDLVMMKEDSFKIMGVIVRIIDRCTQPTCYKIVWIDDLCDPSYATKENLEAVCKLAI